MDQLTRYGVTERFTSEAALCPQLRLARIIAQHRGKYRVATDGGELLAEVSGRFRLPEPPCPPGVHPKVMQEPAGH